jgi:hypothetical protein
MKDSIPRHCSKGRYFAGRLRSGVADPYHVGAIDYVSHRPFPPDQIDAFLRWIRASFDSLRTGLRWEGGQLMAEQVEGACPVEVISGEDIERVICCQRKFCQTNGSRIDLLNGATLAAFYFPGTSGGKSLLRLLYSHFAVDGASKAMLNAVPALYLRGGGALVKTVSYADWMDAHWQHATGDAGAREADWWRSRRAGFAGAQRVQRELGGVRNHHCQLEIAPETISALLYRCRRVWKCLLADAVGAAICAALAEVHQLEQVGLLWTGHGRHVVGGRRFLDTVGWLSDYHPLLVDCRVQGLTQMRNAFRAALDSLPNAGASFRWVANFGPGGEPGLLEEELKSAFRLNYRQVGELPPENGSIAPPPEEPTMTLRTRENVPAGGLDAYITTDVGPVSKVSLILRSGTEASHAEKILTAVHRQLSAFAFAQEEPLPFAAKAA